MTDIDSAPESSAATEHTRRKLHRALESLREGTLLFGLDVDGTLVDHDGVMSEGVHDALITAASAHRVVIATGRSLGATLPIARMAGIERGFAVCSNGAVTVELDPEAEDGWRVLETRAFQPEEALSTLREVAPEAHYAVETVDGAFYATPGFQDASFGVEARATELDDLLTLEAVRVVVHVPDLTPQEFAQLIEQSGVHGVQYAIGWTAWLDMAAPGVSKATALESVRARLNIEQGRTVSVGDGFNDVEMLRWAGVGIAMGQAVDGVKENADLVTLDVWHDGAAEVLRSVVD
ncbi:HAD family hydrolase [Brachybacterium endophyticum]|uniref:HAD family hydrolase n=1 Tax=Brachybacterium endophyticum TaxID=2182385 RepID=A0A2U2RP34_9MICO|nr:HAD family hydrolase [Brachybacterium endophyticum]PWH07555.1 HAD family hydrolase [Brachybacterium endophyticum]